MISAKKVGLGPQTLKIWQCCYVDLLYKYLQGCVPSIKISNYIHFGWKFFPMDPQDPENFGTAPMWVLWQNLDLDYFEHFPKGMCENNSESKITNYCHLGRKIFARSFRTPTIGLCPRIRNLRSGLCLEKCKITNYSHSGLKMLLGPWKSP